MTLKSMQAELSSKLSNDYDFNIGIPAIKDDMGYYTCTVTYESGLKVYTDGTHSADLTISDIYKIY